MHGSSNLHFIQVMAPDNDVVNEVPVFGPGMHPKSLVHVTKLEEGVCDGKTHSEQRESSWRPLLYTLSTRDDQPHLAMSWFILTLELKSTSTMIL